jgi:hypothetical protein
VFVQSWCCFVQSLIWFLRSSGMQSGSRWCKYVVVVGNVAMIELSTNRYLKFLWLRKGSKRERALTKRGSETETDSTPHRQGKPPAFV